MITTNNEVKQTMTVKTTIGDAIIYVSNDGRIYDEKGDELK